MDNSKIQSFLPLTEVSFYILLSLASEPRHGYAIMKDVQTLSEQRIILSAGTLYGALKRLLEGGWIERFDDGELDETGRPRKSYQLTTLGRAILVAETDRLHTLVRAARLREVNNLRSSANLRTSAGRWA
jgi:DNA-binding PadR family transcriptional regulator